MPTLIVLRGLPGSGKTTWAAAYARTARAEGRLAGIVSRDAVRRDVLALTMAPGDQVLDRDGEDVVTAVVEATARALLAAGCDVVADATHLDERYVDQWRTLAAECGADLHLHDLAVDVDECVRRDAARAAQGGRHVGEDVIRSMAAASRPTYDQPGQYGR